jgi:thymidylate synthase
MDTYHEMLKDILKQGEEHDDRTGTGTLSLFGLQWGHEMPDGFPLITTKKMFFRGVFEELKWFLSGSTNLYDMDNRIHKWWEPWADKDGSLGPVYGKQLRDFGGRVDQVARVLGQIFESPNSRRIIMTTWNPMEVDDMKLPCCHGLVTQFKCHNDGGLSLCTYQRSADMFLGFPVNIASYALLLELISALSGRYARELTINVGDAHIYKNHLSAVEEQLSRNSFSLPRLDVHLEQADTADEALERLVGVKYEDFELVDYHSYEPISGELSI